MLIEPSSKMTAFRDISDGILFLCFVHDVQVFGMKIKLDQESAVLHLSGGQPKVVKDDLFINRDVLLLREVSFRFPDIAKAKTGSPDTYEYGAAIISAEGTFVRAGNVNGPYDVEIGKGVAHLSRSHGGSMWFDSWEVVMNRLGKIEVVFSHVQTKATTKTPAP